MLKRKAIVKFPPGAISRPVFVEDGSIWVSGEDGLYKVVNDEATIIYALTDGENHTHGDKQIYCPEGPFRNICSPAYANGKIMFCFNRGNGQGIISIYLLNGELEKQFDARGGCRWLMATDKVIFCAYFNLIQIIDYSGKVLHEIEIDTTATPTYTAFKNSMLFFMVQDNEMTLQQLHEDGTQTVLYIFENTFMENITLYNCAWLGRWIVTDNSDFVFAAQTVSRKTRQGIEIAEFHVDGSGNLMFDKMVPLVDSRICFKGSLSLGSGGQLYYTERILEGTNSFVRILLSPHQSSCCSFNLPEQINDASYLPTFSFKDAILAWGDDINGRTYAALFSGDQWEVQKIPGTIKRSFQVGESIYVYRGSKDGGTNLDRYVLA